MRVEDVMTVDVATVTPETSLKHVARELSARAISGMPVIDGDGRIAGVISEADVLAKQRSEPERRANIVARVLGRDERAESRRFAGPCGERQHDLAGDHHRALLARRGRCTTDGRARR